MLTEWTSYRPAPGRLDEVLETRRAACEVRVRLGLPAGEVYAGEADGEPMVYWSCDFEDATGQAADLQARAASPEFAAVRERMATLVTRFERVVVRNVGHASGAVHTTALGGRAIRPAQMGFASGERTLSGFLYLPPGRGPFPCVVTSHGSTIDRGTTDVCRPGTAAWLMSLGIASFLPHRRGYGRSPGPPWREEVSEEFGTAGYDEQLASRLEAESEDVVAALEYVRSLDAIDADHVALMGSSFGGTVTLLASAMDPDVRCAVEFAGAAINWERTPGLRALMLEAAGRGRCPIFFLQAANDYSTAPTRALAARAGQTGRICESRVYPDFGLTTDEGHFFYQNGPQVWGPAVRRFLERHL